LNIHKTTTYDVRNTGSGYSDIYFIFSYIQMKVKQLVPLG